MYYMYLKTTNNAAYRCAYDANETANCYFYLSFLS